jgi:hypothetical protein
VGRISAVRDALILTGIAKGDVEKIIGKQRSISCMRRSFDMRLFFSFIETDVVASTL